MNVNERIREIAKALGVTQSELAEKIGVSPSYMSNLAAGRRTPGPRIFERLAEIGVNLNWLMTGEGKMLASPQTPEGLDAAAGITAEECGGQENRRWRKPVMPVIEREDEEEKRGEAEQVHRGERIFRRDKRRARVSRQKCRGMMELDERLSTRLVMLEERIERLERKIDSVEAVL